MRFVFLFCVLFFANVHSANCDVTVSSSAGLALVVNNVSMSTVLSQRDVAIATCHAQGAGYKITCFTYSSGSNGFLYTKCELIVPPDPPPESSSSVVVPPYPPPESSSSIVVIIPPESSSSSYVGDGSSDFDWGLAGSGFLDAFPAFALIFCIWSIVKIFRMSWW